jgi:AraC family transcriptional regulator, regulatory protein of adaptative response / methylated-DNA-[protein]-cysteine methyltransferase
MNSDDYCTDAARWGALSARDRAADGYFYYGVRTTGVYCRPSCGARRARPENVRFFDDIEGAQRAGLRPCKRCRPDAVLRPDRQAALIAQACRSIESAEQMPTLASLAQGAQLSRFHFHRLFKRQVGLTPREYMHAVRAQRVRDGLQRAGSVTGAIFDAGYGSSSRFYERSVHSLGMVPSAYRRGAAGEQIRFAIGDCSLGKILVAATTRGVCAILLGDDPTVLLRDLQQRFSKAQLIAGGAEFADSVARVTALVEQPGRDLDLPLDVRGTAFQHRVWQSLRAIPPGSTVSYAEIARRIGQPQCVRAVGQAIAANPLAVAIPCHRVVGSDGSLTGYRWGQTRKRTLLRREGEQDHAVAAAASKTA